MCELPMFVDKDHQLIKVQRTETAFGDPVVPLRVKFSTQSSLRSGKRERPCELEIDHVILVQYLPGFFDKTVFLSISFLPQQNLTEVDGATNITKHLMELLRLMGVIDDNNVLKVRQGLFLNVARRELSQRGERLGK
jgi:hypothetical protein